MSFMKSSGLLNYAGFNQDSGCFAVGTNNGFRIYNCDPFKETFVREFSGEDRGIGYVEMLFRCNILALVGGGKNPRYAPNQVILWDDHQGRCIGELTYKCPILAVKLRRDRIVVVQSERIYIYNFSDLRLMDMVTTAKNDRALIAVCAAANNNIIACPTTQAGYVQVINYNEPQKRIKTFFAHETALACMALSEDGTLIATASEKGTLIRVFNCVSGDKLHEFRRGSERAEIYSIAFHRNNQWLVVSSNSGTVHVFSLAGSNPANDRSDNNNHQSSGGKQHNPTSSLSFISSLLPKYFSSQWSYAQFKVKESRNIVAFGQEENSIIVVCSDGTFFKAFFDPDKAGSECVQDFFVEYLKPE